ncbi:hypothetical protein H6P81_013440 [Aristolochia fimbriata]|uniref:Uncharacterized protein n=1 Tax=Aristolochia fimbriata TaxID=158543 RepID=A0AAV7EIB4_ARIFI|nr:hypothetical protein H6P81_013440 [Aristolochia fimbriata]
MVSRFRTNSAQTKNIQRILIYSIGKGVEDRKSIKQNTAEKSKRRKNVNQTARHKRLETSGSLAKGPKQRIFLARDQARRRREAVKVSEKEEGARSENPPDAFPFPASISVPLPSPGASDVTLAPWRPFNAASHWFFCFNAVTWDRTARVNGVDVDRLGTRASATNRGTASTRPLSGCLVPVAVVGNSKEKRKVERLKKNPNRVKADRRRGDLSFISEDRLFRISISAACLPIFQIQLWALIEGTPIYEQFSTPVQYDCPVGLSEVAVGEEHSGEPLLLIAKLESYTLCWLA